MSRWPGAKAVPGAMRSSLIISQAAPAHPGRVVIVGKRERMKTVQPAVSAWPRRWSVGFAAWGPPLCGSMSEFVGALPTAVCVQAFDGIIQFSESKEHHHAEKGGAIAVPVHAPERCSPDNLALIDAVACTGSMAAAARERWGWCPAPSPTACARWKTRWMCCLFDRSARQACITLRRGRAAAQRRTPAARAGCRGPARQARGHRLGAPAHHRGRQLISRGYSC